MFNGLEPYLTRFAPDMNTRIGDTLRPLFDPEADHLSPEVRGLTSNAMVPFPPQAVAVEGMLRRVLDTGVCWCVGEMGTGKCQRNDSLVLTPTGWRQIGSLEIGDRVVNPDGTPSTVIGVFPQGVKPMFRVTFSDGSSTISCDEHIWHVNAPLRKWRGQPGRNMTLRDIMDTGLTHANGNRQHFIPMVAPADFTHDGERPLDPYVLGLMLGDGGISRDSTPVFTTADAQLLDAVVDAVPGVKASHKGRYDYNIIGVDRTHNPLTDALRELGLMGCDSATKFVPDQYLWSPASVRIAVLQGLLDTDGGVAAAKGNNVEYSTCSDRLRDAVRFIVQSLGGTVSIDTRIPHYHYRGERRSGRPSHRMLLALPSDVTPFRLTRKAARYMAPTKYEPTRCIISVEPTGEGEATCIAVDNPNHLYVTDEFIVTHNTPVGAWLIKTISERKQRPMRWALTCPNQLVKKWQAHLRKIDPTCRAIIIKNWKDLHDLVVKARQSYTIDKAVSGDAGGTMNNPTKRWKPPTCNEIWILPRDKGKLGYAWTPAVNVVPDIEEFADRNGELQRVAVERWRCPKCGVDLKDDKMLPMHIGHFITPGGTMKKKQSCRSCGEPLWQAFNGFASKLRHEKLPNPGVSPRRMAPCQYLRHLGFRFDGYMADEVHELKGDGTLQGQMFADLAMISDIVVPLTGTLTGGYATNLLHLLWRTVSYRMKADGQEFSSKGFEEFVQKYGVLEESTRYVAENDYQTTHDLILGRGKKTSSRTKVKPGISPVLFVNFMLDQAVFIRLREMHAHLPKFDERVHVVRMAPEADAALAEMQKAYGDHIKGHKPCRAWSSARHLFLRWPDKCWLPAYELRERDPETGLHHHVLDVPSLEKKEYPKERRVRRLVTRNMLRGRKTWVFTELTGEDGHPAWDWMNYLQSYLEGYGIRTAVLRSEAGGGPKPEDREEWIAKNSPNVDVVISNPSLVQTGLDLFDFPSIVFAFPGDKTYVLRQASRRAWRLGQKHSCEVDYVVYGCKKGGAKSVQEAAMSLMARKMESALAIEGDFSSEGLAALSGGDDVASQLARFIDGTLDDLDPATDAFARYRKRLEAVSGELGTAMPTPTTPTVAEAEPLLMPRKPIRPILAPAASTGLTHAYASVPPTPPIEAEPVAIPTADGQPPQPALPDPFSLLRSLGVSESGIDKTKAAIQQQETEAQRLFERKSEPAPAAEPESVRDRKAQRLKALTLALGREPEAVAGDCYRWTTSNGLDRAWVQLVAKHRNTVRARNFEALQADHPDGWIAFVEPLDEAGPHKSDMRQTVNGVEYVVSMMPVADYMDGEREPGSPMVYATTKGSA